tara:strand:+ start:517 stop:1953 length:1437 start_codon:yes stop_codon:yes gene_type:complete
MKLFYALLEIAELMLASGPGAPRAAQASEAFSAAGVHLYVLIRTAKVAVAELFRAQGAEVARSCEPRMMDKEEALGHVVAAALGRPLVHEADVRGVGKRADNALTAAKTRVPGAVSAELAAVKRAEKAAKLDESLRPGVVAASTAGAAATAQKLGAAWDYNLKLPDATVDPKRKRTEEQQQAEALTAVKRKAARAEAEALSTERLAEKAATAFNTCLKGRATSDVTDQRFYDATTAADAAAWAARDEATEVRAEADAMEARAEAMEAAEAMQEVEAAEAESEDESDVDSLPWEWCDGYSCMSSMSEIRREIDAIMLAVSVVASGHVRCVACAHLLVRYADELPQEVADPVRPPWPFPPGFGPAWSRSKMLGPVKGDSGACICQSDIIIMPRAWLQGVQHAPRCTECACHASTLTPAGLAALDAGLAAYGEVTRIADMGWLRSGGVTLVPFSTDCWCGKGGACACGPPPGVERQPGVNC